MDPDADAAIGLAEGLGADDAGCVDDDAAFCAGVSPHGLLEGPYVTNVVGEFYPGGPVPRPLCGLLFAQYSNRAFNACILALRSPPATAIVFQMTGKCVLIGCHSIADMVIACGTLTGLLNRAAVTGAGSVKDALFYSVHDAKVHNVVCRVVLRRPGYVIDIGAVAESTPGMVYDPKVFRGARYTIPDYRMRVLLFGESVIVTGAWSAAAVHMAIGHIEKLIEPHCVPRTVACRIARELPTEDWTWLFGVDAHPTGSMHPGGACGALAGLVQACVSPVHSSEPPPPKKRRRALSDDARCGNV